MGSEGGIMDIEEKDGRRVWKWERENKKSR